MTLTAALLDATRRSFDGEIFLPEDPGYDDARRSFNSMIDRRPAVIALPQTVADVQAAIRLGREADLPLAVRGGGHSVAGYGLVNGGLSVDLRRLRSVQVDPGERRAHVAGGATWQELDAATQAHGLAVTGGVYGDTGVAGLTLGGGIGFLMGVAGLACDNLIGVQVVTATGDIVEVDTEHDPEALWAHRGGGGNFGVVTRLDFVLHEVGPMFGGWVNVPLRTGLLERYAEVQGRAPDGLIVMPIPLRDPEAGPLVQLQVGYLGRPDDGRRLTDEIVGGLPVLAGELRDASYADIQSINAIEPFGRFRDYWKSTFVPELTAEVIAQIVGSVDEIVGNSVILIEPMHGQVRRAGVDDAAFPQRHARHHVSAIGMWADAAQDDAGIAWTRRTHASIERFSPGGTYVNYVTPDEPQDRARSAYPPAVYERLRAVKRRFDPENVFRSNVNVAP